MGNGDHWHDRRRLHRRGLGEVLHPAPSHVILVNDRPAHRGSIVGGFERALWKSPTGSF